MGTIEPAIRQTKRERIVNLFSQNLGKRYETCYLHRMFGPSFRSRVSDINRDPASPIRILNKTVNADEGENSVYWGELRQFPESLFDVGPERHRDDG